MHCSHKLCYSDFQQEIGMKDLFIKLEIEPSQQASEQHEQSDRIRLYKSEKKTITVEKRRKKKRGTREIQEEAAFAKEKFAKLV